MYGGGLAAGVQGQDASGGLWSHCVSWADLTVPVGVDHGAARLELGEGWPDRWSVSWKIGKRTESRAVREVAQAPLAGADPIRAFSWRRGQRHRPGLEYLVSARSPKKLSYVPTEAEIRAFYDAVWRARRASDVILINTLLYTGVRVSELVRIRIADVDLDSCRIRITQGKGGRDRVVPFPAGFKETLALHINAQRPVGAVFLFESSWKKPYTDRGVRKILTRYTQAAGITASISPHTLRHFLFRATGCGHL